MTQRDYRNFFGPADFSIPIGNGDVSLFGTDIEKAVAKIANAILRAELEKAPEEIQKYFKHEATKEKRD